jgi:hypothetical protein
MRTLKWRSFLSGLCVTAAVLGITVIGARADVTIERGSSILAFPKVLADGGTDTLIQITNVSNSMVHAHCFYVNAQLRFPDLPENPVTGNTPLWQETDFWIWLTKQQPTHWLVSTGRFVNPLDNCFDGNQIDVEECENAGIDPGAVPPVAENFIGELRCVEVDAAGVPIGGNHFKGEATLKSGGDVAKYNAIGLEATEFAGETGSTLLLNWPKGAEPEAGQQYSACPARLIVNHLGEGATDPIILQNLRGGTCEVNGDTVGSAAGEWNEVACQSNADCEGLVDEKLGGAQGWRPEAYCENGPRIQDGAGALALRSATINDLTLIPCQADFENQIPGKVTIQFLVYNEFEQVFSASTSIECWKNFNLFEVDSPNNPENSVFSAARLGSTAAKTVIRPVDPFGSLLGVHGTLRADRDGQIARTLQNIFIEGDRFSATDGQIVDQIVLPEP